MIKLCITGKQHYTTHHTASPQATHHMTLWEQQNITSGQASLPGGLAAEALHDPLLLAERTAVVLHDPLLHTTVVE